MTSANLPRLALLAVLVVACGLQRSGCVDFDGQRVTVRVDAAADRLDAQLVYLDLHSTQRDPADAVEQLERLRDGARWFAFFGNWPFAFDIDELAAREPAADDDPPPPALAAFLDALDTRVSVRPGPLWLDEQGLLCASQLLRVEQLDDTLARFNAVLLEALASPEARASFCAEFGLDDPESRRLLDEAVAAGHAFVERRGSAFAWVQPVSDAGFVSLQREVLERLLELEAEAVGADDAAAPRSKLALTREFLARTPWALERTPGRATLVLGDPRAVQWTLHAPHEGTPHPDSLLPALREAGWELLDAAHGETLAARFAAFTRED